MSPAAGDGALSRPRRRPQEGLQPSLQEAAEAVKGPPRATNAKGTRFTGGNPNGDGASAQARRAAAQSARPLLGLGPPTCVAAALRRSPAWQGAAPSAVQAMSAALSAAPVGLQSVMMTPSAAAGASAAGGLTRGYGFVATPSFAPGVQESPFITWGRRARTLAAPLSHPSAVWAHPLPTPARPLRVDATPLRLDPEETPIDIGGAADGVAFRLPQEPQRGAPAYRPPERAPTSSRPRAGRFL